MWYTYILRSKRDSNWYIGLTNDLRRRLDLHNRGRVYSTQLRIPFDLVYYEAHQNKHDAAAREQFLKTGWGRGWIKRTLKNYLAPEKVGRLKGL